MLTLILLRHAKSSWADPGLDDFDRPLAARGIAAAPLMGAFLAAHDLRPNLVLCSASARTRATLDLAASGLGAPMPDVAFEDELYLASASQLLARLKRVPARWRRVMMIGHNPGFHDFALQLAAGGASDSLATLAAKFPTAGLAVLNFEAMSWSKLAPHSGHLAHFVTPSRLKKEQAAGNATD